MGVALRPDGNPRLVSYPYYTKLATAGDRTFFRHCDMNIEPFLVDGRGQNIIQGSVSLDDETVEGGCTEIVPGFHRHIADWWDGVVKRAGDKVGELKKSGKAKNVANIYTNEDAKKYGSFRKVLCKRGYARISRPEIIHGSTGANSGFQGVRRTVLPWFVGVAEDNTTLDCPDSDTWDNLT